MITGVEDLLRMHPWREIAILSAGEMLGPLNGTSAVRFFRRHSLELYRKSLQAAQDWGGSPSQGLHGDRELQPWQPPQKGIDRDLSLDAGQRGAQTKMRSQTKSDMAVVLSRQIQIVGVIELLFVTVGGSQHGQHERSAEHSGAGDGYSLAGETQGGCFQDC